jgi:hypothetical protein
MSIKLRLGCAALVLGVVSVAGCGDDETGGTGGSGATGASGSTTSSSASSASGTPTSSSASSTGAGGEGTGGEPIGGAGGEPIGGAGGEPIGGAGGDASGGAGGGGMGQGGGGQGGGANAAGTCADPIAVTSAGVINGDTTGAAAVEEPDDCGNGSGNAPELVYEITSWKTGTLDLKLTPTTASYDAVIYVRTDCATATSELDCGDAFSSDEASVPVTTGQKVYVVVDGYNDADYGAFTLDVDPQETACADAMDNDGNDLIDCEDPDCLANAACAGVAAACTAAPALSNTGTTTGNTSTGTELFAGSCTGGDLSSEVVYSYAVAQTGVLKLTLQSATDQGIYVRTDCDDPSSQINCRDASASADEVRYVGVQAGQMLSIFVDGYNSTAAGPFTLLHEFTPLTLNETEPNDTSATADAYTTPIIGMHTTSDADWFAVTVPGPASLLKAETVDAVAGTCAANSADTYVAIYGPDGTTLITENDDTAANYCSSAQATALAQGTYYVLVESTPTQSATHYAYKLEVTVTP